MDKYTFPAQLETFDPGEGGVARAIRAFGKAGFGLEGDMGIIERVDRANCSLARFKDQLPLHGSNGARFRGAISCSLLAAQQALRIRERVFPPGIADRSRPDQMAALSCRQRS